MILPQTIATGDRAPIPAVFVDEDNELHEELVQLELADLVDDEVDKASRR